MTGLAWLHVAWCVRVCLCLFQNSHYHSCCNQPLNHNLELIYDAFGWTRPTGFARAGPYLLRKEHVAPVDDDKFHFTYVIHC
uniref:Putative secreted protein n=1 Tax=Anopheles marajoara TaxID=58244 RepID=A0A2M4CB97_9DIPT